MFENSFNFAAMIKFFYFIRSEVGEFFISGFELIDSSRSVLLICFYNPTFDGFFMLKDFPHRFCIHFQQNLNQ